MSTYFISSDPAETKRLMAQIAALEAQKIKTSPRSNRRAVLNDKIRALRAQMPPEKVNAGRALKEWNAMLADFMAGDWREYQAELKDARTLPAEALFSLAGAGVYLQAASKARDAVRRRTEDALSLVGWITCFRAALSVLKSEQDRASRDGERQTLVAFAAEDAQRRGAAVFVRWADALEYDLREAEKAGRENGVVNGVLGDE